MKRIVEVCAGSYQDCLAAYRGGAQRAELNSALSVGGLTPSVAALRRAKQETSLKIICMVRPRAAGDVIRLPGGHRLLKKWMIDRKIPQKDRDRTPVLCDNKKIRALFWDRVYTAEKEEEQRAVAVAARRDRE